MGKATDKGWVYVEVIKGMYGSPQAGLLAQELLEEKLKEAGTHKANSPQDCGNTTQDQSSFVSLWTTLA